MALVFSCITGILGVAVVAWYGFAEVTSETYDAARRRMAESEVAAPVEEVPVAKGAGGVVVAVSGSGGGATVA